MHVGAPHLLQAAPGERDDFVARVRSHVADRLHLVPPFTRRLAPMPLGFANPVWVEADEVDLDYHVRRIRLPAPGTHAQLEAAVARLHGQRLDRARPLWLMHVIEGLESGQRALYTKVHHAAVDGAAGVALAQVLLDARATPRAVAPRVWRGEHPGRVALVGAALRTSAAQTVRLVEHIPAALRVLAQLAQSRAGAAAGFAALRRNFSFGPRTPLNVAIESARSLATLSLAAVKRVAAANEAKLNDVVLAIVAGALRRHLEAHGGVPDKPLIAAVPVSLRATGDTEATTLATMTLASLATDVADPHARLAAIRAAAGAAKSLTRQLHAIIPTDFPSLGLPWMLSTAAALYGKTRLAERIPPIANLVASNVPGPAAPLDLAGAKLLTHWPLSIVEHGLGLNVTAQSYAGSLDFGVVAARNALPDTRQFAEDMHAAFVELLPAPARAPTTARRAKRPRPRTSRRGAHAATKE
ncbi:MAG: wax ester/triacylglycerol synthase family O-acyltransferase [Burkholderiaceae bacterium]